MQSMARIRRRRCRASTRAWYTVQYWRRNPDGSSADVRPRPAAQPGYVNDPTPRPTRGTATHQGRSAQEAGRRVSAIGPSSNYVYTTSAMMTGTWQPYMQNWPRTRASCSLRQSCQALVASSLALHTAMLAPLGAGVQCFDLTCAPANTLPPGLQRHGMRREGGGTLHSTKQHSTVAILGRRPVVDSGRIQT